MKTRETIAKDSEMLSVIVPVRDEEEVLPEFIRRTQSALEQTKFDWQIVFVEDSSTDRTVQIIHEACERDSRFCAVFLTRSFGHHEALSAGLDFASGDHIVIMDGDLQHPPEFILTLLDTYQQGYDMVSAKRKGRESGIVKPLGSALINALLSLLSDYPVDLNSSIFRIFSRAVADTVRSMEERNRFLTGMLSWPGFRTMEILFDESPRERGETKYTFGALVEQGLNAVTSFTTKPLRLGIYLGFVSAAASFLIGGYYILQYFIIGIVVEGFTSIIVGIFLMGGMILLVLGIIGEYIGKIFIETKARPLYVVRSSLNLDRRSD